MRYQTLGDKPNFYTIRVRNDSGADIAAGEVVSYTMDGVEDGLAVISPSGSAAKATAFAAGVVVTALTAGNVGEAVVYGLVDAIIHRISRSQTTISMDSGDSYAQGDVLVIDTRIDGFSSTVGSQSLTQHFPYAVMAESVVSVDSFVSASDSAQTHGTTLGKVFLRML